jgi:Predicted nucleotide-binding protein containing TIR-like domain
LPSRRKHAGGKRPKAAPEVFIASSGEQKQIIYEVQSHIEEIADVTPWDKSFPPSTIILEQLINTAKQSDFGIFIFAPDDVSTIKGEELGSVRDNVVFEAAFDSKNQTLRKLLKGVEELHTYVERNQTFIPNYGERYRNGERIASGFVEWAVNQVISKRMSKRQQMHWTQRGALASAD